MDRPTSPELDAIMDAADDLRLLEARVAAELAEARQRLALKVDALAEVTDPSDRLRAAVYAYWYAPEASANQLALLTVGKPSSSLMLRHSKGVSIGISCDRCSENLPITSRSMMSDVLKRAANNEQRWAEGYRFICPACEDAVSEQRKVEWNLRDREKEERRQVLARMTYTEYLATPEWRGQRSYAESLMLEARGKLTCEVCPEREGLSYVHSQFDLLGGNEVVNLLCATCSGALERAGKLARPPLSANRAPRIELDLAEREFRTERYGEMIDDV